MNVAIIDLGTNTFNLLICSVSCNSYKILHATKRAPKMGQGGIQSNIITTEAYLRSIQALQELNDIILSYSCNKVIAIGTSALRNAKNSEEFCNEVKRRFGFSIQIISGLQEAEYIYWGNRLAYDWGQQTALILDIGGGSNEIIIATNSTILWKHSFENGMQRIISSASPTYPLTQQNKDYIHSYLESTFELLYKLTHTYSIDILIGSSGPFDTFRTILSTNIDNSIPWCQIPYNSLKQLHQQLISSTIEEINSIEGMDAARVEMLPIASSIALHICNNLHIQTIIQSDYSLKEGVIYSLLCNNYE
ncbi:MAG: Guanosine-5'-triphosphate,3'-diphosphate pyrophosphatase [Bacteroidetes bacterium ADurb.Bin217]|nr:MAG: Guanosine-5'-triphosphate,3'-diphosphate pyrophosphatase [Bacteroidetes bacterium ADurb.Bin217]